MNSHFAPDRQPSTLLRRAVVSGSIASLASTAVLALLGQRKLNRRAAMTNATSHWLWGEEAYSAFRPTWRHTAVGYVTHHASAVLWAFLSEHLLSRANRVSAGTAVGAAAATTATAAFVDYVTMPKRLTPGFERHLSTREMVGVFAAIGAGLAVGALVNSRLSPDRD